VSFPQLRSPRFSFDPGQAAVQVGGDLSATLGALTLSADSSVSLNADLSKTLGILTLASAGSVSLNGDLSKTLGALTLSADGSLTVTVTGDLSATLGALALSSAGSVSLNADLAKTLGTLSLASASSVSLNGDLAKTLGALTLSADGTQAVASTGDISVTLGSLSLLSDATVVQGGTVTGSMGFGGGGSWITERQNREHGRRIRKQVETILDDLPQIYAELTASPEAKKAAAIVKPFAESKKAVPAQKSIDWKALQKDAARVGRLLALWQRQRAIEDDEETWFMLGE
jgi:hypothetical protein